MGQVMKYTCECGYNKDLRVGVGLMSNRETAVRRAFSDGELVDFDKAKSSNMLTRFYVEYEPANCPVCRTLVVLPLLRYWTGEQEHTLRGSSCPSCGGTAVHSGNITPGCPKCGKALSAQATGHWD